MLKHKYSDKIHNKKVLIVGNYPPPFGGVGIHIKRVKRKLEQQKNTVTIFDTSKTKSRTLPLTLFKKLFKTRPHIVHVHEPTMSRLRLVSAVLFKFLFRYKLIIVDHNCRILYNFSKQAKKVFRFLVRRADHVVLIGDTTHKCYVENGISCKSLSVESPFLAPDLSEEAAIFSTYTDRVKDFVNSRRPLITANAFKPTLMEPHKLDLYGFDMCVGLIERLAPKHPEIGLLFGLCKLGNEKEKKYFEKIQTEIRTLGLENHFCFFIGQQEFWPLIKKSDLFVRPTLSDSFGISVQEAILVGTPAVASDVCKRPKGTVLYQTAKTS